MKAWAIENYGSDSKLKLMDFDTPKLQANEVLIEIKAASINPVDFKIRDGKLKQVLPYELPLILGNDCSGVIVEIGKDIKNFKVGDEIYTRPGKNKIGTLAEFIAVAESDIALKPKSLSFEEAAGIPLVGLTSWQALFDRGELKSGDRVFIPAGSGGVGSFAVQLAKRHGAYVYTNTSGRNVDFVKSLGADRVFNYKEEDFSEEIEELSLVFDTIGGETQNKAISCLKKGGKLVSIVGPPTSRFMKEMNKGIIFQILGLVMSFTTNLAAFIKGVRYEFMFMTPSGLQLTKIAKLIDEGSIKPVVDKVYPFEEANEALAHVERGHSLGKVIVSRQSN